MSWLHVELPFLSVIYKQHKIDRLKLDVKKIPVVPVSYREKIRVSRSEINIFFMVLAGFLLRDFQ
jgi:hypothetical protein